MKAQVFEFKTYEDGSARLMARIVGLNNTKLIESDFGSISWETWYEGAEDTQVATGTLTVADVIFDSLETESWTADGTGYNFRWDIPATVFASPKRTNLSLMFTLANDDVIPFPVVAEVIRTAAG